MTFQILATGYWLLRSRLVPSKLMSWRNGRRGPNVSGGGAALTTG